jgi:hypothetical protein
MGSKKRKSAVERPPFERPPFGTDEFWARHEAAERAKAAKKKMGEDVKKFIDRMVKKHGKTRDCRRDLAWFLEQYGCNLRSDVEREKTAERRKEIEERRRAEEQRKAEEQ